MKSTISTEYRNAGMWLDVASADRMLGGDGRGVPRPWLARIKGLHHRWKWDREFITPMTDWLDANSTYNRGVMMYWHIDDGVYEGRVGRRLEKVFYFVSDGEVAEIEEREVLHCLAKNSR